MAVYPRRVYDCFLISCPTNRLKEEINKNIAKVLEHGQYINGPEVYELEEKLANHILKQTSVLHANGTDALQIAFGNRY